MIPTVQRQSSGRRTARAGGQRGPQPSISAEEIYARALELVDAQGMRALEARRLAAHLGISTRTLYKRIGNQHGLIRGIAELHLSRVRPDFVEGDTWESTAWNWCEGLRQALCAHPHLTELMTNFAALAVGEAVDAPIDVVRVQGLPSHVAVGCCRALVDVTVNQAIRDVRSTLRSQDALEGFTGESEAGSIFRNTIRWILVGVREESAGLLHVPDSC
nr:TetR family transcriptional regulator [Mycolicibacterium hodleri]